MNTDIPNAPAEPTLVMDVGGTHTRLALAWPANGRARLSAVEVISTPRGQLQEAMRQFLAKHADPSLAAIAIAAAGRIRRLPGRTTVSLTNAALGIEREELQSSFAVSRVHLVNDLAAIAAALPWLAATDLASVGGSRTAVPGHRLVVGIGTGFGAAALTADGHLIETEAGHADIAAVSASERRWLDLLAPLGRCAVEQVLSGPGLLRLHEVIAQKPLALHEELRIAHAKGDAAALRTLTAFSVWLGRTVGNLVLSHGAWGGVLLAGGVLERLGDAFDGKSFRQGFEDKAPFSAELAAVPVWHIRHAQPALVGLARLATV